MLKKDMGASEEIPSTLKIHEKPGKLLENHLDSFLRTKPYI